VVIVATADDLPIGAAVCAANRQDASFTGEALASVVVPLPVDRSPGPRPPSQDAPDERYGDGRLKRSSRRELRKRLESGRDVRALPYLRADGNFAKVPARNEAKEQGFRLWAPDKHKGQSRRGLGPIRSAVERAHALLNQFGRIFRRLDRKARCYLGWVQLACCVIFMRQGFFP
jgi:hypothetical protein